jgi:two-component system sensor histidine kinase AlgZ
VNWIGGARRGRLLYLLAWLIAGAVLGGVCAVMAPANMVNALLFAVPGTLAYGMAAGYSAYFLCRANPVGSRGAALILVVLCSAAVLAGLWLALLGGWNQLCLGLGTVWAGIVVSPQLSAMLFTLGMLLYGLLVAVNYLAIESGRARSAERRGLEAQLMAQDAELRMLRTQIDPHFLFNSLNSISALTSIDPKGAREMTLRLAGFFRRSLGLAAHRKITLAQEMELIRDFLAIEKVRFGERLMVEEALETAALDCLVPPMLIQPLVENAIKHGIGQLTEAGLLRVAAKREGPRLSITVSNAIDPDTPAVRPGGIGLANVRQRLACAYPNESAIDWTRAENTFSVALRLPAQTNETNVE